MYNYKDLKIGKHDLPTWDGLAPVVLEVVKTKNEWKARDLDKEVANSIGLPSNLRNLAYENYPDSIIVENRVRWALSEMNIAGLLTRPRRGAYKITDLGEKLLKKYGVKVDRKIIHGQEMYQAHQDEIKQRNQDKKDRTDISKEDLNDDGIIQKVNDRQRIEKQIDVYNDDIANDLLTRIRDSEPAFFEVLVVDLLSTMGYQGTNGNATVTQLSSDGGIDGIINQDPLGTSTVYIQAKRYQVNNIVQRPDIERLYGALSRVHADRGVFITTSSFSAHAKEAAENFSIVMIDGIRLTNLMLKYHVGVQAKRQYELFEIDEDYFED